MSANRPKSPLAAALAQRCRADDNWLLRPWQRWALAFKAAFCYALGWEAKIGDGTPWRDRIDYFGGSVIVAILDGDSYGTPDGTMYWWEELLTPRSWRRWSYVVMQDGAP